MCFSFCYLIWISFYLFTFVLHFLLVGGRMPLLLRSGQSDGQWTKAESKSGQKLLELIYEKYVDGAVQFYNTPQRLVIAGHSLYVGQRECAVVPRLHAEAGISVVGSDDATTCHIMILVHQASGTVAVAHFDGVDSNVQLKTFLKTLVQVLRDIEAINVLDTNPLSLDTYFVGGFDDARCTSERLSEELLWLLYTQPLDVMPGGVGSIDFNLKLACISKLNTVNGPRHHRDQTPKNGFVEPWPAVFGAAIDLKSAEVFPCVFDQRGPEEALRSARHFSDESDLLNVYDHKTKRFFIKPFVYYAIGNGEAIVMSSDEWIVQHMSTSPKIEPPHFAASVRETIRFTLDNPNWRKVFAKGDIEYEMIEGRGWVKVAKDT